MSANTILTSILTGGSNNHTTVSEEANSLATDFVTQGVVGAITLNSGSGGTGSFCVNADASPDMGVTIKAGQAWISATPSSQGAQMLRARASSDYTAYTINSNSSGSTKYDWIYLKVDPTKANNPASDASDVTSIYTSRSSSNSTDNGTPPTYGVLLAIVTVANAASSITNSNITDKRFNASIGAQNGSLVVTQSATGQPAIIQAAGQDANINVQILGKGGGGLMSSTLYNPYKFSVYRNAALTSSNSASVVPHDTKLYDTSANVDVVTNKGRFTAPITGFYTFKAMAGNSTAGTTPIYSYLYKNGSRVKIGAGSGGGQSNGSYSLVSGDLQLSAGDYIEHYFIGGAGSTMDVGSAVCYFEGRLVSAT